MAELIVHNPPRAALKASGYIGSPEGDIELTENDKTYNVTDFATATTRIPEPPEPTGTKEIIENGVHDVKEYAFADVKIPEPSGTIVLDENNRSYDVTDYAAADVAIPEEEKTVTPSAVKQEITPDNGLLSKVTVLPASLEERTVTPTIVQQTITPEAPAIGLSKVTVGAALPPPILVSKQVTENGTYAAEDDNADGYDEVTVAVPTPTFESKAVTPMAIRFDVEPSEGFDGLSKVTVNATPLEEKTIIPTSQQQVVTPTAPNIGLSSVTVGAAPQPTLITKQITANGTYAAADDNADGFSDVTVAVPDNFTKYLDKTIEEVNSDVSGSLHLSFANCSLLKTVYLPNVTSMLVNYSSLYLFKGCNNLERINMGSYINIPNFWLQNNNSVKEVTITGAQKIGQYAFENCSNLVLRELPSQVSSIDNTAFRNCISIPYLDMSNLQQIPTLGSGVFSDTTFPFYFRDQQQLEEFATATNWSTYADRFQIKGVTS